MLGKLQRRVQTKILQKAIDLLAGGGYGSMSPPIVEFPLAYAPALVKQAQRGMSGVRYRPNTRDHVGLEVVFKLEHRVIPIHKPKMRHRRAPTSTECVLL